MALHVRERAVGRILYSKTHEYLREDGSDWFLGITEHAQDSLGDITFVELPESGAKFDGGDEIATVESVKAVASVMAPVSMRVMDVNGALEDAPELINSDAQGAGWMARVEVLDASELDALMDQAAYDAMEK
jgi:glycine cleavage system H protein